MDEKMKEDLYEIQWKLRGIEDEIRELVWAVLKVISDEEDREKKKKEEEEKQYRECEKIVERIEIPDDWKNRNKK